MTALNAYDENNRDDYLHLAGEGKIKSVPVCGDGWNWSMSEGYHGLHFNLLKLFDYIYWFPLDTTRVTFEFFSILSVMMKQFT